MRALAKFKSNWRNELVGFLLLSLAAIIFLSLNSYDPMDTPAHTSAPNASVSNTVGMVGAYVAEALLFAFGISAYLLPVVLLIWAWNTFWGRMGKDIYLKLTGMGAMLLSVSGLCHMFDVSVRGNYFRGGGVMGPYVSYVLGGLFGAVGERVVAFTLFLVSVLLTTEFLFVSFGVAFIAVLIAASTKAGRFVYEGITGSNELPGGVSVGTKKRPPKVVKSAEKTEKKDEPEPEVARREAIKINEMKRPEPYHQSGKEGSREQSGTRRNVPHPPRRTTGDFELPPITLLDPPKPVNDKNRRQALEEMSELLESTLATFDIEAQVVEISQGPAVTRFELKLAPGIKVNKILALSDDLALALEAYRVRIEAPIPGKAAVGIEVPNKARSEVCLREVIDSEQFRASRSKLTIALGKTITGDPLAADLAGMPHLLIAGATGSGKTVCVNSLIASILYNCTPEEVRFMMIDPKVVELSPYNGVPHLLWPVITDPKEAGKYLNWLVSEMEDRYKTLARAGARNIESYNQKLGAGAVPRPVQTELFGEEPLEPLPYIVTVIDELADLMMVASIEVEDAIMRLAQLARAVGIHLVLATQRPSVDVITGVIKANFPARISFQVSSKVDSRTVLDMNGAEKLIGKGDLLYLPAGLSKPIRAQGVYITDPEINRIVEFLTAQRQAEYLDPEEEALDEVCNRSKEPGDHDDALYDDAVRLVLNSGQASISMLQRRLRVGYARAARLIDMMELDGVVGPSQGSQVRDILVGQDYLRAHDAQCENE
ncbi:DNA translocase FtsK [Candidatus Poribacteria bacterium]|nr:DNA translocase FtsK [Candidatus Poribacteria bacterium]